MALYETERLILRHLLPSDDQGMFELDSDPEVHRYLGGKPVQTILESQKIIERVCKQYAENGIGRWAVIEKSTNKFIGWSGLKLCTDRRNGQSNYYDLGYRLIPSAWGKGYATECSMPAIHHTFEILKLSALYANAMKENGASRRVLEKLGFSFVEYYLDESFGECAWYELTSKSSTRKVVSLNAPIILR
jgi:RimJ/RimL family protein N-acetyltransferase